MSNFTPEQLEAIEKDGQNIIVSAGAGSGKTTVLTARVIRKLKAGADINRLLVLTFTNEAALNMKNKIRRELIKNNMEEALLYLDEAYITTFDSYALSLVKKYNYILNINKDINIIDSTIIDMKRKELLDEIFESMYDNDSFKKLISNFTTKDDDNIKLSLLNINKVLDLKYDKIEYLDSYIEKYYSDKYLDELIVKYTETILSLKNDIIDMAEELCNIDGNYGSKVLDILVNLRASDTFDDIKNNLDITLPRIPNNSDPELSKLKDSVAKEISNLKDLTSDSLEDIKNNIKDTKEYVEVIIQIIKELTIKLDNYKEEIGNYEFIDIAKMAIKIVSINEEVRNELKNHFLEIMVDEYQDTNDLQELFINLISNNNLYMVGDIKQSIYRFRNANPKIFMDKYNKYSKLDGGYKIDLLKNFRSREEVLDNINRIFNIIMTNEVGNADYISDHQMVYGGGYEVKSPNQDYNLEIYNYDYDKEYKEDEIEAFVIASDIKNKLNNHYQILDNGVLRDFTYSDASIIIDRATSFDTYKKIFEYLGIPLSIYQDKKLNEENDILIIKNLINLIVKIYKKEYDVEFRYYFTSIARSYLFEYDDNKIFEIFRNNTFYDTDIYKLCLQISNNLEEVSTEEFLGNIIKKFNIYENTIKVGNINETIIRMDYIISQASSMSKLGYTPIDFGNYLKESEDFDIKYSVGHNDLNSVKIMTIHKSKGLEFNICYFAGYNKNFNIRDIKDNFLYSNSYGIITPYYKDGIGTTILKKLYTDEYLADEISEKVRLLYVAMTRTKEKMIIVTHLKDDYNKQYKSFLDIIDSIKNPLNKYIKDIDYKEFGITKDYDFTKSTNFRDYITKSDEIIKYIPINIENDIEDKKHFSKSNLHLYTKEELNNMKFGEYIHHLFEMVDFKNPNVDNKYKEYIDAFINQVNFDGANIYKEYEFIYNVENIEYHGIIDLMLEYKDHIDIYDYKLKNILDDAYAKQLSGYKKYIENKMKKPVNTYLYSIFDKKIRKIDI